VSGLTSKAQSSQQAVGAFHTHHSKMTWNAGTPGIEPWLRDTLVSLQMALNQLADTQVEIARQVDQDAERIARLERAARSQR
jgi:hypothetical protein